MEWRTIDKGSWGPGEWQDEPDKVQWKDKATGLPCLAVRNGRSGNWCGYVGVSAAHPWHGLGYSSCTRKPPCEESYCDHAPGVEVHGGLTFADACQHSDDPSEGICHIPEPGEPDKVWWFGFDCHHHMDFAPAYAARYPEFKGLGEHYRDLSYVQRECTSLARQLAEVSA
jgi:hypothetical protein